MSASRPASGEQAGQQPLTALRGVGPALSAALARLDLEQVRDAWFHLPLRYEDRTSLVPFTQLREGQAAQVEGVIEAADRSFQYRPQLRVALGDDEHGTLVLRFFHFRQSQLQALRPGTRLRCFGDVRLAAHGAEMVHPQYRRVSTDTPLEASLTPVYPTTEGVGPKRIAGVVSKALDCLPDDAELELVPEDLRPPTARHSLRAALLTVHRPAGDSDLAALADGSHPACKRLAFEELLAQHLSLRQLRSRMQRHGAPALTGHSTLQARFVAQLPFALTPAQQRVATEVTADLGAPSPMLRLLQGDVGSGKTVVAALAALLAMDSGYQVALVAPTEVLAEQHYTQFRSWFEPLGIEVLWLTGRLPERTRRTTREKLAAGAGMIVGTHALMQDEVTFAALGLVIIDEQHRFGVHQRLSLRDKGRQGGLVPHQLVLTATPIPRTLTMSAYADLSVSSIDELPPGRTPVQTVTIAQSRRDDVVERIRAACAQGRQAYWVCTLIDESEQLRAQAAEAVHTELTEALPELSISLVHGRMKAADKQAAMAAFKAGEAAVLVATTVIEVGVDVPNASLMVIEDAERLGLAQLHQLRGRVGRGHVASSCVLLYGTPLSAAARQRLRLMRETSDGFRIAEKDLELRGPGEVLGTRQTGRLELRIADLVRDAHLLPEVARIGDALLQDHPEAVPKLVARWVGAATRYADA